MTAILVLIFSVVYLSQAIWCINYHIKHNTPYPVDKLLRIKLTFAPYLWYYIITENEVLK